jgi:hypothetical protein
MEGDDGVSRSVRARKKAIETQWLARVLETGQVREESFSVRRNLLHHPQYSARIIPRMSMCCKAGLQDGAKRVPPRGDIDPFLAA